MLQLQIINDGTGDRIVGNYTYRVLVNLDVISEGTIKGHLRHENWVELLKRLVEEAESKDGLG